MLSQPKLTVRQAAERIEQFGDDLAKLMLDFDRACNRMPSDAVSLINAIPNQDQLDVIAEAFRALGDRLCGDCDEAEEANDRHRMVSVGGHLNGGSAA